MTDFDRDTYVVSDRPRGQRQDADEPNAGGRGIEQRLWGAFRRRWFTSIMLGLVLGSTLALVAWRLIPAHYTATAEIQISSVERVLLFKTAEQKARFSTYKQTLMQLLTRPVTLDPAIEDPRVEDLVTLTSTSLLPRDWLEENLAVRSVGSEFFTVSLTGDHPEELKVLVEVVTDKFMEKVVRSQGRRRTDRLAQLTKAKNSRVETVKVLRNSLRDRARKIDSANSTQAGERQEWLLEMQLQIRKELADIKFQIIKLEVESSLATEASDDGSALAAVQERALEQAIKNDPEVLAASDLIEHRRRVLDEHERVLGTGNDRVVEKQRQLEQARESLTQVTAEARERLSASLKDVRQFQQSLRQRQLAANLESLRAHRDRLEGELVEKREQTKEVSELTFAMISEERDLESSENLLKAISSEIEKVRLEDEAEREMGFDEIKVISPVTVPYRRRRTKQIGGTLLAGFGGLGFVVAVFVWIELLQKRVHTLEDVAEGALGTPVMGSIPRIPSRALRRTGTTPADETWQVAFSEAIDSIRTLLLCENVDDPVRSIMVTSAVSGEGKTTVSCHLALSLARAGRSVLLIDSDIRRPSVDRIFDVPSHPGFCQQLAETCPLEDAVHPQDVPGLWVMSAGAYRDDVHRLLCQGAGERLFERLLERFDFVVIDTSPLLPVTDTLLLAQQSDGVVFSVRSEVSRLSRVRPAIERLQRASARLLGLVVSGLGGEQYSYRYSYAYPHERDIDVDSPRELVSVGEEAST